jgi:hypothetical protein
MSEQESQRNETVPPHADNDGALDAGAILTAEFEYIAQSAFQANEDRARVSNFYIVSVGSLVAATLTTQSASAGALKVPVYWIFSALFIILSLTGLSTTIQLAQLRIAWANCVSAMNRIKEYAAGHVALADFAAAFLWTNDSRPPLYKPRSLSFLLALQVALLGGCTCAAAVLTAGLHYDRWLWTYAIGSGIIFVIIQLVVYWALLKAESQK